MLFCMVFLSMNFVWCLYIMSPLQVIAHEVWYFRSFVEVGKVTPHFDYGIKCMPDRVWPSSNLKEAYCGRIPGHLRRLAGASLQMASNVSCIKSFRKQTSTIDDGSNFQDALYLFIFKTLTNSCYIGSSVYSAIYH